MATTWDGKVLRHPAAVELVVVQHGDLAAALAQCPFEAGVWPSMKSRSMPGWRSARQAMTRGIMIGASVL